MLDSVASLRDVKTDTKSPFMKTQIFPIPLVAIAGLALFGSFAMSAAEQDSSTPATTPNVSVTASTSAGSSVQLSSGVPEVLKLARSNVNNDTIVAFVGNSKKTYNLSANEIVYLRQQGVSDRVLTAMLDQRMTSPETSVAATAQYLSISTRRSPFAAGAPGVRAPPVT